MPGPKVCFARFVTLFLSPFFSLRLKNVVLLSAGFETALNESVKNCKAPAQAAEQKEVDRVAMSEAILAFCRAFGVDGDGRAGGAQGEVAQDHRATPADQGGAVGAPGVDDHRAWALGSHVKPLDLG